MNSDQPETYGLPMSDAENKARQDANDAASRLQHDLDAVSERAAHDVQNLKQEAQHQVDKAAEKAKTFATDQKDFVATQVEGVASAMSRVADELDGDQATTARYMRDLANGLERFGQQVKGKNVDELFGEAERFGRSQPLAFLGGAALAGFLASRFAGASAQRRENPDSRTNSGAVSPSGASYGTSDAGGAGTSGSSAYGQSSGNYAGGGNVSG
ncbi:hypothetical protein NIM87_10205 [Devosia sp. XJ19-1]|uniref:Nutrient deprivation-induced protein n=1 Tax=Devosia ureilytica TaxID=2952754 RepID=A0A9Q4APJ0_9HYPH|nr:hypothetical protein [Devosia ureilytica]MCP8883872.1 hypothetical protein [Devosia ureilytica]MCP8887480.1 hypothetical protein [Devosia ureilytica]